MNDRTRGTRITDLVRSQRDFFNTGETRPVEFRMDALRRLRDALKLHEEELLAALHDDVRKPPFEAFITEVGPVMDDLKHAVKNLVKWMDPERVKTPLSLFPARSRVYHDPYGVVLIIAPWNYPLSLVIAPLIGALAAGNCAVLKTSPLAEATTAVLKKILGDLFPRKYVAVVEEERDINTTLLNEKFDYIFFTGGASVGREVYRAAAGNLTPVTLELGGKSPCIVADDADMALAARRIAWGKFVNAGQVCVAPDYLVVSEKIKGGLVEAIIREIRKFYGDDPSESEHYARIISDHHFRRLTGLMEGCTIVHGGRTDPADRYIAPTIIDNVKPDHPLMKEEIFGPLLPIITTDSIDDAVRLVKSMPEPLSLYLFTGDRAVRERIIRGVPFGGGCVNDTLVHVGNIHLPFGGVGQSGTGSYHGYESFKTFSHAKSVVLRSRFLDNSLRYAPYRKYGIGLLKLVMG